MIEYKVRIYEDDHIGWRLKGKKVTEEEHKRRTSKASYQGKVVVIDGVEYELKEV